MKEPAVILRALRAALALRHLPDIDVPPLPVLPDVGATLTRDEHLAESRRLARLAAPLYGVAESRRLARLAAPLYGVDEAEREACMRRHPASAGRRLADDVETWLRDHDAGDAS